MDPVLISFASFLGFLWFLVYWILGGVFFALVAILRLGRVRKVRFSCLFSLWTLVVGYIAAFAGIWIGRSSIESCYALAQNRGEVITAFFGCGFAGVLGMFIMGAALIVLGGFAIMSLSKNKTKPWFNLDVTEEEEEEVREKDSGYFA